MFRYKRRNQLKLLFLCVKKYLMEKNSSRLVSLDIFRGLTVAFMIIVNTPGSWKYVYSPLRHASWNGCTPTDLVFPFFLFIVGISMWYSLKKYGHELNGGSILRILRRTITVFAIGLFLNIFPYFGMDYTTLRILGVLQRIALVYCISALICLIIRRDYLWIVIAVILILYWALLAFFGGAEPFSLEENLVRKIDIALLGEGHLSKVFGIPFEPEGLLSTLPAVCTVIIGYYIGGITGLGFPGGKTVLKLILLGAAASGLGLLWNMIFPINKPLWTSSYTLYTGGIAIGVFAVIYLVSDVLKFQKWGTPFMVLGTNALFAYFLAGLWTELLLFVQVPSGNDKISLYGWFYGKVCVPIAGNLNGSLMFAIIQVIIIWLLALILFRKKIYIKL
jgi:predicted acyltransferase